MSIYTRQGDNGSSSLFSGETQPKNSPAFEVLGTLDELNASLGFAQFTPIKKVNKLIITIQKDIFVMGASLSGVEFTELDKEAWVEKVRELEISIDTFEKENKPLNNFILPGGSSTSTYLHFSRAVCRRAERNVVSYTQKEQKFSIFTTYLNRLSDLLFVMARYSNSVADIDDVVWRPERDKINP